MGIGDLLLEQFRALRRDLGVDERDAGRANSVEDVYAASGVHGVFSAAVGGNTPCTPEEIADRLHALLPEWVRLPPGAPTAGSATRPPPVAARQEENAT